MKLSNFIKSLKRLRRFGFIVWLTDLLYDRGKQLLSHKNYLRLIARRHEAIEKYISEHVPSPQFNNPPNQPKQAISGFPVWFMWLQGEADMPDIVRLCYRSAIKYCGEGKVILLTKENLNDYVTLPPIIMSKYNAGKISSTHLSDIIRVCLLAIYGGGWMDSTVLLTKVLPTEYFQTPTYCIKHPRNDQFVFQGRWSIFFWAANNRAIPQYIYECLLEYYTHEDTLIDYFLTDYMVDIAYRNIPEVKSEIDSIPPNNPCSTQLKSLMNTPFCAEKYKELTTNTWAFKLTYKGMPKRLSDSDGTYFNHIYKSL